MVLEVLNFGFYGWEPFLGCCSSFIEKFGSIPDFRKRLSTECYIKKTFSLLGL